MFNYFLALAELVNRISYPMMSSKEMFGALCHVTRSQDDCMLTGGGGGSDTGM